MRRNKKGPSYLDVTQYILSGPFEPRTSPAIFPIQPDQSDNLTPLSRPMFIEIQAGQPSPYLKELLSKVGSSEIEFMDFTLDGDGQEEEKEDEQLKSMSIIEQEQSQHAGEQNSKDHPYEYNPQEYIPNMHLLQIDLTTLTFDHFQTTLNSLTEVSQQQRKEYILLYLTDTDLQTYKDSPNQKLIQVVKFNLTQFGMISRLERKAKVARYIQKKKKRIWKKKINYDCRKKVADNRLRVKGKFVTREQACQMLGIQLCNQEVLKDFLKSNSSKFPF